MAEGKAGSAWDGKCRRAGSRRAADRRRQARRAVDALLDTPETVEHLIARTEMDIEAARADSEGL